jgi:hypothetical protein
MTILKTDAKRLYWAMDPLLVHLNNTWCVVGGTTWEFLEEFVHVFTWAYVMWGFASLLPKLVALVEGWFLRFYLSVSFSKSKHNLQSTVMGTTLMGYFIFCLVKKNGYTLKKFLWYDAKIQMFYYIYKNATNNMTFLHLFCSKEMCFKDDLFNNKMQF